MHGRVHEDGEPGEIARILENSQDEVERDDVWQDHGEGDVEAARKQAEGLDEIDGAVDLFPDENVVQNPAAPEKSAQAVENGKPQALEKRVHAVTDD